LNKTARAFRRRRLRRRVTFSPWTRQGVHGDDVSIMIFRAGQRRWRESTRKWFEYARGAREGVRVESTSSGEEMIVEGVSWRRERFDGADVHARHPARSERRARLAADHRSVRPLTGALCSRKACWFGVQYRTGPGTVAAVRRGSPGASSMKGCGAKSPARQRRERGNLFHGTICSRQQWYLKEKRRGAKAGCEPCLNKVGGSDVGG